MSLLRRAGRWLGDRIGFSALREHVFHHPIPPGTTTRKGWMYVFGNALVATFLLQVVTGTALATKYIPSPEHAWQSLQFLNEDVWFGSFIRAVHFFGASAMVVLVFVHMTRVFLTGSFKFPREMNWLTGSALLVLVLAMAFTGQLLRWDQDGVWTVMVAAKFAGRVPLVGGVLMELILAGDTLGGATLSRFFALHVIIFPLLIFGLIGLHVFLAFYHGVSEPPEAGRKVDPKTYRPWYRQLLRTGDARYWPDAAWREMVFIALVFTAVVTLALVYGPKGPGPAPDPTEVTADPRPDWYFRWYYTLIWLKPRALDQVIMVWLPLFLGAVLLLMPFVASRGERAPQRRPWAIALVASFFLGWATLTAMGLHPRWVPRFSTEPPSADALGVARDDPVYVGAVIFHARGCQYCHQVADRGGFYGPDLTDVTRRMSQEEITVRIMNGVRNMPAYREVLTVEELERIQAYLEHLGSLEP